MREKSVKMPETCPTCPACNCYQTVNNNEDNDCNLHAEFNDFSQICKFRRINTGFCEAFFRDRNYTKSTIL